METYLLKLTFIEGLKDIVVNELKQFSNIKTSKISENFLYVEIDQENFKDTLSLKSITSAYIVKLNTRYNPKYINKHKSILGELLEIVLKDKPKEFKTFRLRCAGSQSDEISQIEKYIQETYKLTKAEDVDLEIYINKIEDLWEICVRLSPRPLSVRAYKDKNIKGGLNPNIAYTMNTFCDLKNIKSYLNIFSGSGTLVIEAGLVNPNIKLVGLDIDKKTNSLAIQNIKKAGLIKNIQIKTGDIFDSPDIGKFDAITANLPFGMQISKGQDLIKLYEKFIEYSTQILNKNGQLVVYTTEYEILENILKESPLKIIEKIDLKLYSSINSYLYPKIFICNLV
jgi:23S rRNA G2445 N2-methylase RlmL